MAYTAGTTVIPPIAHLRRGDNTRDGLIEKVRGQRVHPGQPRRRGRQGRHFVDYFTRMAEAVPRQAGAFQPRNRGGATTSSAAICFQECPEDGPWGIDIFGFDDNGKTISITGTCSRGATESSTSNPGSFWQIWNSQRRRAARKGWTETSLCRPGARCTAHPDSLRSITTVNPTGAGSNARAAPGPCPDRNAGNTSDMERNRKLASKAGGTPRASSRWAVTSVSRYPGV